MKSASIQPVLSSRNPDARRGALMAGGSFLLWGLLPLYWKQLQAVPATELLCHRMVWSLFFLLAMLAAQGTLRGLAAALAMPRLAALNILASLLLAANLFIYVWGVNHDRVIEISLGYFLSPLCYIALGRVLLRERLRRLQWAAVILAAFGVALLLLRLEHAPWVAFGLASTWAFYGVLKKKSALGSLHGLTIETLLLFPFAAAWLVWLAVRGGGAFGHATVSLHTLVIGTGLVTAVPLLMFAWGARRLRFTTIGLLQYLGPTLQFLIGLLVYHEPMGAPQLRAFAFIWAGLLLYTADSFFAERYRPSVPNADY
jgi:chloramphenicol-sensitive protein RarD